MKKILSLFLTMCLLAGMGIGVRASVINEDVKEATKTVEGKYRTDGEVLTVVSVDIAWKGMSFTYTDASEPLWDAEEHQYVASEGHWEPSDASITITNHSNAVIQAHIAYQGSEGFTETKMFFTDAAPVIGSAETSETGSGEPCAVVIEAVPGGILTDKAETATGIGVITVGVNTNLGSDSHIAAFDKLAGDWEKLVNMGYDPEVLKRGDVYFSTAEEASAVCAAMDELGNVICNTQLETYERNLALNELIALFYESLAIKQ